MSNNYGPIKWYRQATQSFHADCGRNLPSGVTLTNAAGASASLFEVDGEDLVDVTSQVTVADITIVDGRLSGDTDAGIDYTLTAVGDGPDRGDDYLLRIEINRTDGVSEVAEQPLEIT